MANSTREIPVKQLIAAFQTRETGNLAVGAKFRENHVCLHSQVGNTVLITASMTTGG